MFSSLAGLLGVRSFLFDSKEKQGEKKRESSGMRRVRGYFYEYHMSCAQCIPRSGRYSKFHVRLPN